jgi:cytochrome b6-f complex iron-sulfur subunit
MENAGRRTVLTIMLGGMAALAAGATAWPVLRYLAPRRESRSAATVTLAATEVTEGQARFFQYDGATAVLVRRTGGQLAAFSAVCTHLGCVVQWEKEKQTFLCPCHAGRYNPDGTVLAGPPPRPLAPIPFTVAGGTITVGRREEGV